MKTSELQGEALDWAVAKCEGDDSYAAVFFDEDWLPMVREPEDDFGFQTEWKPSTDWSQGGPIIERENIAIDKDGEVWCASMNDKPIAFYAPTPLIAAMRCFVASRLGDEIEVPAELIGV